METMTQWFSYLRTLLLLLILCLLIFPLSTNHLALAQTSTYYSPTPVSGAAVARTLTDLYVTGGAAGANPGLHVPQFASLNLNIPWNTSMPAWSKHADSPEQDLFPAAFSSDEKILYVFHLPESPSPFQWDSNMDVWKEMTNVKFSNATWQGIGAVTDPRTGLIYMAGGYNDDSNLGNDPTFLAMDVFDPVSQTLNRTHLTLPPSTFLARLYYGNVWCKARNSILYWGGHTYPPNSAIKVDMVSEFKPDTQTWGTMATTGTTPTMRSDHCIVPNEDGTKVIIYGGRLENETVVGDISVLDTVTQTWTAGAIGPPRIYAACTVAGDQLIIWGGKSADNSPPPSDLLIYNFVTRTWPSQYNPPASYRYLKDPPALTRTTAPWPVSPQKGVVGSVGGEGRGLDTTASTSPPVGTIVGGVVAGLVLVVVCVGVFVFRRRRQTRGSEHEGNGLDEKEGGKFAILKSRARTPFAVQSKNQESRHEKQEHPVSGEAELQQTLQELQELENQQQELEQKRLQLVLQQQHVPYPPPPRMVNASGQLRGPTEYSEPLSEYRPPPNNPEFIAPLASSAEGDSNFAGVEGGGGGAKKVGERRTVQDTTGMSTNFMDWTVRSPNNPHAVVGRSGIGIGVGSGGGVSRPLFSQQQQQQQHSRAMSM